jgi:cobalt-zinc-cadmium efflux system outer membrane protein
MSLRLAAVAACVAALSAAVAAQAADPLSLADAYARVEASHPDLRVTGARRDVLAAELDQALLHPPLVAGAAVEDLPISGAPRNA